MRWISNPGVGVRHHVNRPAPTHPPRLGSSGLTSLFTAATSEQDLTSSLIYYVKGQPRRNPDDPIGAVACHENIASCQFQNTFALLSLRQNRQHEFLSTVQGQCPPGCLRGRHVVRVPTGRGGSMTDRSLVWTKVGSCGRSGPYSLLARPAILVAAQLGPALVAELDSVRANACSDQHKIRSNSCSKQP